MKIAFIDDRAENQAAWLSAMQMICGDNAELLTLGSVSELSRLLKSSYKPDIAFVDFFIGGNYGTEAICLLRQHCGHDVVIIAHSSMDAANAGMMESIEIPDDRDGLVNGADTMLPKLKGEHPSPTLLERFATFEEFEIFVRRAGMRIGIDFGGVIVKHRTRVAGEDTPLLTPGDTTLANAGVFEAVKKLIETSNGNVWVVSKAGPAMQTATVAWLESVNFYSRTGLSLEHVKFCIRREEKADICHNLGISHFIDDKVHVMQILRDTVAHLYMFGESSNEQFCPPWATFRSSWAEVRDSIIG